jgi:hypothetical protein
MNDRHVEHFIFSSGNRQRTCLFSRKFPAIDIFTDHRVEPPVRRRIVRLSEAVNDKFICADWNLAIAYLCLFFSFYRELRFDFLELFMLVETLDFQTGRRYVVWMERNYQIIVTCGC